MAHLPRGPSGLSINAWLEDLREAVAKARGGNAVGAAHQLRVATRRLDVWLRLGGYQVLRDDLRWLRGIAGPVRDLDVLATLSPRGGLERLAAEALTRLELGLADPRVDALLAALALLPALEPARVRRATRGLASALVELVVDATDVEQVHRRRRRMRRLRYALELLGEPLGHLPALQEALGVVSDARLQEVYFPMTRPEPMLAALEAADKAWHAQLDTLEKLT